MASSHIRPGFNVITGALYPRDPIRRRPSTTFFRASRGAVSLSATPSSFETRVALAPRDEGFVDTGRTLVR